MADADAFIDVTSRFYGDVLGRIRVDAAVTRVLAYCTDPHSGWGVYDLAAIHARNAGVFSTITAWSLLWANALNGQVTLTNLADFSPTLQRDLAGRIAAVTEDVDLHTMTAEQTAAVVRVCQFGFEGVWTPKITKVAALYRPAAIPVLDGHVAKAFGYTQDSFSSKVVQQSQSRQQRIAAVVEALADAITTHLPQLQHIRDTVAARVPEIRDLPLLRLLDIVLWTSQDDRMPRRDRQGARWDQRTPGTAPTLADYTHIPVSG